MKRAIALFIILSFIVGLMGCGKSENNVQSEGEPKTIVFKDDCGRKVEVPETPTRIVASGPLSQIILFALSSDELVGLAAEWHECADGFIDKKYYELPYFGQLYGSANLNMEELALAEPQLIIDVGEPKGSIAENMDNLTKQTNIPTVHIDATLDTMMDTYRKLGKLLNKEEKAEELAQFCEKVYDRTVSIMEQVGEKKVNALYITGEEGNSVLAKGSYHAELIDMLTNNVAIVESSSSRGAGDTVDMEQIVLWDPDFIIFTPMSYYSRAAEDGIWNQLKAIRTGNYIEVPEGPHNWMGSPPAVQRYLGMIWLPAILYPAVCDYDVESEIKEYYKLFYDCEMTQEQYDALTANAFLKN